MNTLDVKKVVEIHNFDELYSWAKEQFLAFEVVEGIIPETEVDLEKAWESYDFCIDCPKDQLKFKDMMQIRFIEELTEASVDLDNQDHFHEEITDALNFFLAGYIMLGTDFKKLPPPEYWIGVGKSQPVKTVLELRALFYQLVEATGYLCNLLKNRPWSQSNYLVSMVDFNERLESLWCLFWQALGALNLGPDEIFDLFARKLSVNLFRIRSKY